MSDQLTALKARCYDLQEANTNLSNYLVEIAKALGLDDVNQVYPTVVKLLQKEKETKEEKPA